MFHQIGQNLNHVFFFFSCCKAELFHSFLISAHIFCVGRVCIKCAQTQISRLKNFIFQSFFLSQYRFGSSYRHHYRLILLDPARNCHRKKRARNSSFREFLTPFFTKIGEKPRFYREFLFFVIRKVTSTIVIISATNTSRYSGRMKNPMEFPRIPKIGGIKVVPMYALAI